MIKAAGRYNGRPMLVIGLSGENMARLMDGEPITFDAGSLGLPATQVLVVGGRTEDTIRTRVAAALRHPRHWLTQE